MSGFLDPLLNDTYMGIQICVRAELESIMLHCRCCLTGRNSCVSVATARLWHPVAETLGRIISRALKEPAYQAKSILKTHNSNTIQYNTSWGTETPPGTSLQAYFVAHGRSNIVRNLCNCTIPYPLLRHSVCGAPVTPRGSDMYPNTLWVGAAIDGGRTHDLPSTKRAP